MVLVGEHDEFAGNAAGLQHVEHGKALGNGESVVELVVDNKHGSAPVVGESRGIPFLVHLAVLPERTSKVVLGEEELFRLDLVERAEDTVVADDGLELASEIVSLDPV